MQCVSQREIYPEPVISEGEEMGLCEAGCSDDRKLVCQFANLAKSWQNLDERV